MIKVKCTKELAGFTLGQTYTAKDLAPGDHGVVINDKGEAVRIHEQVAECFTADMGVSQQ